jgi:hypothetical protein
LIAVIYPFVLVLTASGALLLAEQWKKKAVTSQSL